MGTRTRTTARPGGAALAPTGRARPRDARARTRAAARRRSGAIEPQLEIRPARPSDLAPVIAIDTEVTGLAKPAYWRGIFRRYADSAKAGRHLLVATASGEVVGFIIGEVRDWEFGSPPCGWVFGIDVRPGARLAGVGTKLLAAIVKAFRRSGVATVRTILARENALVLSFFRSQGMMAGPFISLEMELG
ncbi:MAG: GNAT family N-acetyltransferase [Burkholderiales bacterium]|nr:GNAT family N-acetyltransferase [Burkholderiales bacterium]